MLKVRPLHSAHAASAWHRKGASGFSNTRPQSPVLELLSNQAFPASRLPSLCAALADQAEALETGVRRDEALKFKLHSLCTWLQLGWIQHSQPGAH